METLTMRKMIHNSLKRICVHNIFFNLFFSDGTSPEHLHCPCLDLVQQNIALVG